MITDKMPARSFKIPPYLNVSIVQFNTFNLLIVHFISFKKKVGLHSRERCDFESSNSAGLLRPSQREELC